MPRKNNNPQPKKQPPPNLEALRLELAIGQQQQVNMLLQPNARQLRASTTRRIAGAPQSNRPASNRRSGVQAESSAVNPAHADPVQVAQNVTPAQSNQARATVQQQPIQNPQNVLNAVTVSSSLYSASEISRVPSLIQMQQGHNQQHQSPISRSASAAVIQNQNSRSQRLIKRSNVPTAVDNTATSNQQMQSPDYRNQSPIQSNYNMQSPPYREPQRMPSASSSNFSMLSQMRPNNNVAANLVRSSPARMVSQQQELQQQRQQTEEEVKDEAPSGHESNLITQSQAESALRQYQLYQRQQLAIQQQQEHQQQLPEQIIQQLPQQLPEQIQEQIEEQHLEQQDQRQGSQSDSREESKDEVQAPNRISWEQPPQQESWGNNIIPPVVNSWNVEPDRWPITVPRFAPDERLSTLGRNIQVQSPMRLGTPIQVQVEDRTIRLQPYRCVNDAIKHVASVHDVPLSLLIDCFVPPAVLAQATIAGAHAPDNLPESQSSLFCLICRHPFTAPNGAYMTSSEPIRRAMENVVDQITQASTSSDFYHQMMQTVLKRFIKCEQLLLQSFSMVNVAIGPQILECNGGHCICRACYLTVVLNQMNIEIINRVGETIRRINPNTFQCSVCRQLMAPQTLYRPRFSSPVNDLIQTGQRDAIQRLQQASLRLQAVEVPSVEMMIDTSSRPQQQPNQQMYVERRHHGSHKREKKHKRKQHRKIIFLMPSLSSSSSSSDDENVALGIQDMHGNSDRGSIRGLRLQSYGVQNDLPQSLINPQQRAYLDQQMRVVARGGQPVMNLIQRDGAAVAQVEQPARDLNQRDGVVNAQLQVGHPARDLNQVNQGDEGEE